MKRLPSFNDLSPGILKKAFGEPDIRKVLQAVASHPGDRTSTVSEWATDLFGGTKNKRSSTNVPTTLGNTGLLDTAAWELTPLGEELLLQPTCAESVAAFAKTLLLHQNGMLVIDAIKALNARSEQVTKASLKTELIAQGIEGLSTATTDHTTLQNWLVEAKVLGPPAENFKPRDATIKNLTGISGTEREELQSLTLPQQIFLSVFRRMVETEASHELAVQLVYAECARDYKGYFDESQISAKILQPLETEGWIILSKRSNKSSGGKSGTAKATKKLLDIPMSEVLPNFDAVIPADLRNKRNTPRDEILALLNSASKNERGLGLELLALRMIIDLGLEPRSFRIRTKDTAYAELDLTAEGTHLAFSRWNIQCKCITGNVSLSDVAKEVGLAIYSRAHVVAVVTTSDFSKEAVKYCREITQTTHLQFLLVPGRVVEAYLQTGATRLIEFAMDNAKTVMALKRAQPIDADE